MAIRSRRVASRWLLSPASSGLPGASSSFLPTADSASDLAVFAAAAARPTPIGPSGPSTPAAAALTAPLTPSGAASRRAAPSTRTPARTFACRARLSA